MNLIKFDDYGGNITRVICNEEVENLDISAAIE